MKLHLACLSLGALALLGGPVVADKAPQPPKADPPAKEKESVKLADRTTAALQWLADHQNADGYWSSENFGADSKRAKAKRSGNLEFVNAGKENGDAGWSQTVDVGLTGLALLAFVGGGFDHTEGEHKDALRRALMYLRKVQSNDGCFGPKDEDAFVYCHAIACMAITEAYGMSGDKALSGTVERGVKFILDAQNPGAGWRYGVKYGESDTSFTGWAVMALKTAKLAGIEFEEKAAFDGASAWLDKMTVDEKGVYRTGYNQPGGGNARLRSAANYDTNPTMDAINICARLFMGRKEWDTKNKVIVAQCKLLAAATPSWEMLKIDYIYWFWGSLAAYQVGGETWSKWCDALKPALVNNQRGWRKEDKDTTAQTLDEHGSWDAVDAWAAAGGRVYGTAINCMLLHTIARYERMNPKKPK